jgi:hypothetical protein
MNTSRDRHLFNTGICFCFSSSDQFSTTLICLGRSRPLDELEHPEALTVWQDIVMRDWINSCQGHGHVVDYTGGGRGADGISPETAKRDLTSARRDSSTLGDTCGVRRR